MMSPSLKSPIIVWVRWNEGMVVMGRRPITTVALSVRLCSIQEHWLHLRCGQTLNLCYVCPSTFLLEDNRRIAVTVAGVTRSVYRRTRVGGLSVHVFVCEKESNVVCIQLRVFFCPSMTVSMFILTSTLLEQILECFAVEWGNDSVFTGKLMVSVLVMTDWYFTVLYRKLCC